MSIYDTLNDKQKEAVFHTEGPLLILAGAGSGKTRVLTHRIAYLIEEKGVNPWNILAITFTNKAAAEMRERVDNLVGFGSESIWVSTFHSMCVRILRRHIALLGYDTNFTIYDTDDQKTLMRDVCKLLQIDTKIYKERMLIGTISHAKNEMLTPEEFRLQAGGDFQQKKIADVYEEYEKQLRANNALDFDDLLLKTVQLFQTQRDVLEYYQERFRYIMVDEYQDTNGVQFELVRLLASRYQNLCVVGDDDQSIYKFRGADIRNILDFEKVFTKAAVIKLEQNYRSTANILNAANAVISHNHGRKDKTLWTDNEDGDKIAFRQFDTAFDEAEYIVSDIKEHVEKGECDYQDNAILYRTNAQSRMFEEKFVTANIPYKIIGGINFYARREIKDILAYLKTVDNGQDDLAVRRIINVPKRGIGLTSINRVQEYAAMHEKGIYECLKGADLIPDIGRGVSKLESFVALIEHFKVDAKELTLHELMQEIIDETGYIESIQAESEIEAQARIENIDELLNKVVAYEEVCEEHDEPVTLSGFLEEVALVADIDNLDENSDYVVLMTLHSAKGLEFPNVYLAGLEDGLFPSYMSITSDNSQAEIEEERRLAYVGITRAKKNLTITSARVRMVRGQTQYGKVSRFVREIPPELLSGKIYEPKTKEEPIEQSTFQKARKAFRTVPSYGGSGYGKEVGEGYGSTFHSSKATKPVYTKVENQRDFGSVGGALSYQVGDRVRHIKFGDGEVMAIVSGGRDYEVTVDFDKVGTKKMFASFAKLKKI